MSRVVTYVAAGPLAVNRNYSILGMGNIEDLAGNNLSQGALSFRTGSVTDATAPTVVRVTPVNALTEVPTNASVVIEFNEPIRADTMTNVVLSWLHPPPRRSRPAQVPT